jgi:hypothetical protein
LLVAYIVPGGLVPPERKFCGQNTRPQPADSRGFSNHGKPKGAFSHPWRTAQLPQKNAANTRIILPRSPAEGSKVKILLGF